MTKRERKGLTKKLTVELSDQNKRLRAQIDEAITSTALQLYFTKDEIAEMLPFTIKLWNETADRIERELGKGFFPIRLGHTNAFSVSMGGTHDDRVRAMVRLDYMAGKAEDPSPFRWMHDLLFMAEFAPEVRIQREAGPRNSAWHNRIRKTKKSIMLKQAKALADALDDANKEDDPFWRGIRRIRTVWEGEVRKDSSYAQTLPAAPERKPYDLPHEPPAPFKPRLQRQPPIDPVADAVKARTKRARTNRIVGEIFKTIRPRRVKGSLSHRGRIISRGVKRPKPATK